MRVIAFSCCHLARPETQEALHGQISLDPFRELIRGIIDNPPDIVINLGDFEEDYYDRPGYALIVAPDYAKLPDVAKLITLKGNHDKAGELFTVVDGVRYEHGDNGTSRALEGDRLIKAVRARFAGQRIIYGHTHKPFNGWGFDVGSVTYSQTYAEIIDGQPFLRLIDG